MFRLLGISTDKLPIDVGSLQPANYIIFISLNSSVAFSKKVYKWLQKILAGITIKIADNYFENSCGLVWWSIIFW